MLTLETIKESLKGANLKAVSRASGLHYNTMYNLMSGRRPTYDTVKALSDYLLAKEVNLFWISWYQPTEDHRPLSFPPNEAVLGWWNTGSRCGDSATIICSLVAAETDKLAKEAILKDWPEADEWRFVSDKENTMLNDRFPLSDWMKVRVSKFETGSGGQG